MFIREIIQLTTQLLKVTAVAHIMDALQVTKLTPFYLGYVIFLFFWAK
jgi:hypothetical protein